MVTKRTFFVFFSSCLLTVGFLGATFSWSSEGVCPSDIEVYSPGSASAFPEVLYGNRLLREPSSVSTLVMSGLPHSYCVVADPDFSDDATQAGSYFERSFDLSDQLIKAADRGDVDALGVALKDGALINFRCDQRGETALFHAVRAHKKEAVLFLLAQGASACLENDHHQTAADVAISLHLYDMLVFLVTAMKKDGERCPESLFISDMSLFEAILSRDVNQVRDLVQREALDLNASMPFFYVLPMQLACQLGDVEMVACLAELGARFNVGAIFNQSTPLYLAAQFGHTALVDYLFRKFPELKDSNGFPHSPLYAALCCWHYETAFRIIASGVMIDGCSKAFIDARPELKELLGLK